MVDRVSEALRRLRARFVEAEAQVDAARGRARRESARRLREILARPARTWPAALDDKALTPVDRAELERALAEALPHRRKRVGMTLAGIGRRWLRHARYRRRGLIALAVVVAPTLGLAWSAWTHTLRDAVPVRLAVPYTITWTLAGGQTVRTDEVKEAEFVWFRRGGRSYLRRWFDGRGYGEVEVPDAFTRDAVTLRR